MDQTTPLSGGGSTVTATATIDPTGPEATSSARSISTDISVVALLWRDFINHPSENKADDLIDKINLILLPAAIVGVSHIRAEPLWEGLLSKLGLPPAGTGRDCKPSGNPIVDIFNAVKCLVDTLTQTTRDLTEAIKDNFVDISKIRAALEFIEALQAALDNPQETEEQKEEQEQEKSSTATKTETTSSSSSRSSSTTSSTSSSSSSSSSSSEAACLWGGMSTSLSAEPAPQGPLTTAWFDYGISCGGNNCAKYVAATGSGAATVITSDNVPISSAASTLTSLSAPTVVPSAPSVSNATTPSSTSSTSKTEGITTPSITTGGTSSTTTTTTTTGGVAPPSQTLSCAKKEDVSVSVPQADAQKTIHGWCSGSLSLFQPGIGCDNTRHPGLWLSTQCTLQIPNYKLPFYYPASA
ncbi:MAG: hypothetical protein L6R40_006830 [Gallowayella cf. fulva]|nr:MAG: hypothetical protein L6R40_006830 [Xanthomendoza cf. fulva]